MAEPSPDSSIDDDDDDDDDNDVMVVLTDDRRVGRRNDREDGENAVATIVRLGSRNVDASKRSRGEEMMMIHERDIVAPALC
jgi:hypothetical protein